MNAAHTPGRWIARSRSMSDGALVIKDATAYNEICVIRESEQREHGPQNDIDMANALLIAASPEMLETLKELAEFAAREMGLELEECVSGPIGRARAALAKAQSID